MQANQWQFRLPWWCSSTTRGASPDGAHPGLHLKPLDAAIGRVPAPYCPGGRHGRRFRKNTQNTNKTQLLASNYSTFRASCLWEFCNTKDERDPLLTSSMRHALFKCETPRIELKSSRSFLAIKRWQRTKIKKVIKHLRSSKLRWAHICAHSRIPVKWKLARFDRCKQNS